jgi:hypothetical protein
MADQSFQDLKLDVATVLLEAIKKRALGGSEVDLERLANAYVAICLAPTPPIDPPVSG